MIGGYSIMNWVGFGFIFSCLGVLYGSYRDNKLITEKFLGLSKEHDGLLKEDDRLSKEHDALSRKVTSERLIVSRENESIKEDTKYIHDEILVEKMAREDLYKNTSRAKEILDTMDMMKEVVVKNAELNRMVSTLEIKNQELLSNNNNDSKKLLAAIRGFNGRLSEFETYSEAEDIRLVLRKIESELTDYVN